MILMMLTAPPLALALTNDQAQYDQCVLQSLRGSRNGIAANMLQNACDRLYRGGAMLSPGDKTYYVCLLQSLPGVENNGAIQQIMTICSRQRSL